MKKNRTEESSGIFRRHVSRDKIRYTDNIPAATAQSPSTVIAAAGLLLILHTVLFLAFRLLVTNQPALSALFLQNTLFSFITGGIITQGFLILVPVLLIVLYFRMPAGLVSGGRPLAGSILLGLIAGIPAAVVFQGLNNLLIYLLVRMNWQIPFRTSPYGFDAGLIWQASWQIRIAVVLVSALVPAMIEELMFRGVVLGSLSIRRPGWTAIFWQAIVFMLFHQDPLFLLPPFLSGLLLGLLRYKSQSILPPMLCHMTMNLTLLAVSPLLPRLTANMLQISTQTTESLLYASLIAACIAAVALVPLVILINGLRHAQNESRISALAHLLLPANFIFTLAFLVMLVTMILSYYQLLP